MSSLSTDILVISMGLGMTVAISLLAIVAGFAVAMPVSALMLSRSRAGRGIGRFYVSFFRGVPLLVMLLLIYYMLPFLGLQLPGFLAGALGLALCTAAYQAENLRGGFLTVPEGQREAARAAGYDRFAIWRLIVLPQAVRAALPAIVTEMIAILKASSLVSVVGVADLTRMAQGIVARTFQPFEWYLVAALIYLALNVALSFATLRSMRGITASQTGFRL